MRPSDPDINSSTLEEGHLGDSRGQNLIEKGIKVRDKHVPGTVDSDAQAIPSEQETSVVNVTDSNPARDTENKPDIEITIENSLDFFDKD